MGLQFSKDVEQQMPPKVVLVPPMFERDLKSRSRMTKSSYDYLFAKPALKWLLNDYFTTGLQGLLYLSPGADPRVSVKARWLSHQTGNMSIRYQPYGVAEPLSFVDIKMDPQDVSRARVRACYFDTDSGIGMFASVPLVGRLTHQHSALGLRYSSPSFTVGAALEPQASKWTCAWMAGRLGGLTAALQLQPHIALHDVVPALNRPCTLEDLANWTRRHSCVALGYSPQQTMRGGQPTFTATIEVQEARRFVASFFQHMAVNRQVVNPLENEDVIGITNYLDLGIQLVMPLPDTPLAPLSTTPSGAGGGQDSDKLEAHQGPSNSSGRPQEPHGLMLGVAWQVNKNLMLKARAGMEGLSAVVAFKSWFQPSLAVAACVDHSFLTGKTRFGGTMVVENFGALRYERSRNLDVTGKSITQRHEATDLEMQVAEGYRPLVMKTAKEGDYNVAEPRSVQYL